MKIYPPKIARRACHRRVPAFMPVPLRARIDGWTPKRQADFLGALAETRSVVEAARRVAMARESAYRLRRKPGAASFAAAWDAVIGKVTRPSQKVTAEHRCRRATEGLLKPLLYRGKHVATIEKADNSALLSVVTQLVRAEAAGIPAPEGHTVSLPRQDQLRPSAEG